VRWLLATNPDVRVVTYDGLTYAGNLDSLAEVFAKHGAHGDGRHFFVKADICDAEAFSADRFDAGFRAAVAETLAAPSPC